MLAALAMPLAALAQAGSAVWRCGADQRLYTDEPCAGGRPVEMPAPRPQTEVQAAHSRVAREAAGLQRQRREREAREAAAIAASSQPVNLGPVRAASRPTSAKLEARRVTQLRPSLHRPARSPGAPDAQDATEQTWRAAAPASRRAAD
jgi:hypothetical protein